MTAAADSISRARIEAAERLIRPHTRRTPVVEIDGRRISAGRGPIVERLQRLYQHLIERDIAAQPPP